MISSTTAPPEFLTSHIAEIKKTDPCPDYTFDYVGSKQNVRSLMGTLSPHLFHQDGYFLGKCVIVEHAKILFSHIQTTRLLKQYSEDAKESLFLRGTAALHLADGINPASQMLHITHDYLVREIELKRCSRLDESARCYQLAIKYFEQFEATSPPNAWACEYIRPSSVAKNQLMTLVSGSPKWAFGQDRKKLSRYFDQFEDPISEGYWPIALNILSLTQNFNIPLSGKDNDSGLLISINSLNTNHIGRLPEKERNQLLKIWQRVKVSVFSSSPGHKRKTYGPSVSMVSLSKRKVEVSKEERKIADL